MEIKQILNMHSKEEFYCWLSLNHTKEKECWVEVKRGEPVDDDHLWYLDAVEVALCFGWIDSTVKKINGKQYNRFSKRNKNSPWTELNKERVRRLIKLNLMSQSGLEVLPPIGKRSFKIDEDVKQALIEARAYQKFKRFPKLYQRVRAYNVSFYKDLDNNLYQKALQHLIEETKKEKMYGQWNDYGRLLDY